MLWDRDSGKVTLKKADVAILEASASRQTRAFLYQTGVGTPFLRFPPLFCPECLVLLRHSRMGVQRLREALPELLRLARGADGEYRAGSVPKADGSLRTVYRVSPSLAAWQRWILRTVLPGFEVAPAATAYRKGMGVRDNAARHLGRPILVRLDIRDFFGHIRDVEVYRVFASAGFPREVATLLTKLCCRQGVLPQGASTSPALANLCIRPCDELIQAYCDGCGIVYSRYCDDLCFSGSHMDTGALIAAVSGILAAHGFSLNRGKTAVLGPGAPHNITGVMANTKLQAPAAYRKALRQELYYIRRFGLEEHMRRVCPEGESQWRYLMRLMGRLAHALYLDPENRELQEGMELARRLWLGSGGEAPPTREVFLLQDDDLPF